MSKEATISKVYYDLEKGFGSIAKTHQAAKKIDPSIKREDVKAFLDKQELRQGKKRRGDNSFIPFAPREQFQLDLADFGAASVKYRYAFVCIDSFSKKLAVVPLESKRPTACVEALNTAIGKMGTPNYVYTDDGGEFKGAFEEHLKQVFIEHIITRGHAIFAERVIRTLREGVHVRLETTRTGKAYWWKFIDQVVNQYNDAAHMTTGEAPNDIHNLNIEEDKDWIEELRDRIAAEGHRNRKYPTISVGDQVKLLRKPGKFGDRKTGFVAWSKETYRVEKIEYQDGSPLFFLEGRELDNRGYRLHEILKVDGVEKPLPSRSTVKRAPAVSLRPARDVSAKPAPPPPVARRRIRGKTADPTPAAAPPQPVARRRVRGKTADPARTAAPLPPQPVARRRVRGKTTEPTHAAAPPQPPQPVARRRVRGKTADPTLSLHPLADMIAA
jgi:hypothetical protein